MLVSDSDIGEWTCETPFGESEGDGMFHRGTMALPTEEEPYVKARITFSVIGNFQVYAHCIYIICRMSGFPGTSSPLGKFCLFHSTFLSNNASTNVPTGTG